MKILKIILGSLAAMFVLAHLIEIPAALTSVGGDYAVSWWLGKLAAIVLGTAISIDLFKSALGKKAPIQSDKE